MGKGRGRDVRGGVEWVKVRGGGLEMEGERGEANEGVKRKMSKDY